MGDGTYVYGCPSRWGDAEQALIGASADERTLVFGSSDALWASRDQGCTATRLDMEPGQVPVALLGYDEGVWALTRDFDAGTARLWDVREDQLRRAAGFEDALPTGMAEGAGALWFAGVEPELFLSRLDGEVLQPGFEFAAGLEADALTLMPSDGRLMWVRASVAGARQLWRAGAGEEVTRVFEAERSLHGPVPVDGRHLLVADGEAYRSDDERTWSSIGPVDWTCLGRVEGRAYACSLSALLSLDDAQGNTRPLMSLEQVAAPDDRCPDPDGLCELDWFHFGGESGWVDTTPATCPLTPREPLDGTGCGCAQPVGGIGWAWVLWVVLLRRQRASSDQ